MQPESVYPMIAQLLEYPNPLLAETATLGVERLAPMNVKASACLERLRDFAASTPLSRQEEVYTHTFDLQVVCYPYVGYQMFGESYKRGQFLVKIRERYGIFGFDGGRHELPDYLPTVLRFLGSLSSQEERMVLVRECLVPSVRKMIESFGESENVYADVLRALQLLLEEEVQ